VAHLQDEEAEALRRCMGGVYRVRAKP
jgi:hypothetical protein